MFHFNINKLRGLIVHLPLFFPLYFLLFPLFLLQVVLHQIVSENSFRHHLHTLRAKMLVLVICFSSDQSTDLCIHVMLPEMFRVIFTTIQISCELFLIDDASCVTLSVHALVHQCYAYESILSKL